MSEPTTLMYLVDFLLAMILVGIEINDSVLRRDNVEVRRKRDQQ